MKSNILGGLALFLFLSLTLIISSSSERASAGLFSSQNREPIQQSIPIKKPKYDYMSTFLSRNTKPLGLKEDLVLKKLLKQASIKWAIRAGARHILD
jgi:hypothetical protein